MEPRKSSGVVRESPGRRSKRLALCVTVESYLLWALVFLLLNESLPAACLFIRMAKEITKGINEESILFFPVRVIFCIRRTLQGKGLKLEDICYL